MKNGGKRKSFTGPKKSFGVNKSNPTGGIMKNSAGFTGRAVQPTTKPTTRKGNP